MQEAIILDIATSIKRQSQNAMGGPIVGFVSCIFKTSPPTLHISQRRRRSYGIRALESRPSVV